VACLCNLGDAGPSRRARQVADVYLASLMKPKEQNKEEDKNKEKSEIALAAEQLKPYPGDYWSEELGVVYRLGLSDGSIKVAAVVDASGAPRVNNFRNEMRATGADEFEVGKTGVTLHFSRDANQGPSAFTLDAGRTKGIVFQRRQTAPK